MTMKPLTAVHEAATRILEHSTRRHFLRDCATGLGAIWLAGQQGTPASAAKTDHVEAPQFPARVKRVIFLHMIGAPSQLELFDYRPELHELQRPRMPAGVLGRPTICLHPRHAPDAGSAVSLSATRRIRGLGLRSAAAFLPSRRRRLLHQVDADGSIQSRPGAIDGAHRTGAGRVSVDRIVGHVGAGNRERRPAGVHRAALRRTPAAGGQRAVEFRVSAVGLSGRSMSIARRSGTERVESGRRRPADAAGRAGHPSIAEPAAITRRSAIQKR